MSAELSRRSVLKWGAGVGGGIAIGVFPELAVGAEPAAPASFQPSAWLEIFPDNKILVTVHKAEMGQGVATSLPLLIAEELEVAPAALSIRFAQYGRVFRNPELLVQVTGGSSSVRTSWQMLRDAGATARELLRSAAADAWKVSRDGCEAKDGKILHAESKKEATYGELAAAASKVVMAPPAKLREKNFKRIGQPTHRLDAQPKVTGTAEFGIDVKVDDLLTAVVLRCPVPGGRAVSFNAAKARNSPGIVRVIKIPQGVAVVARHYWQARRAAQLVEVGWDEGEKAAMSSATIREKWVELGKKDGDRVRNEGDALKALEGAATKLEAVYELPYMNHATMEPMNATAWVRHGKCTVWAPTQGIGLARDVAARVSGLALSNIEVNATYMGGGFGRRATQDFVGEAVAISKELQRPVKVIWSREDDMHHGAHRPASYNVLRAGLDASGKLVAWHHRVVQPSILNGTAGNWMSAMLPRASTGMVGVLGKAVSGLAKVFDSTSHEGASTMPYSIPNLAVDYVWDDPGIQLGFWRSVGHSIHGFVVEGFLDEAAHAAKKDPLEFRQALLGDAPRHKRVLELAASKAGWGSKLPAGRFRGLAQHESFHSFAACVAEVAVIDGAIKVHKLTMAIDCGTAVNPDGVRQQLESGAIYGLSAAMKQQITWDRGRIVQSNFHDYPPIRMNESPEIECHIVPNDAPPTGCGEPGVPVIAPAVANAVFAATGKRLRSLPFKLA
jgi:isoquinoline 1-oxidoreductase subunit beta